MGNPFDHTLFSIQLNIQSFQVPEAVREAYTGVLAKGAAAEAEWNIVFAAYAEKVLWTSSL